MKAAGAWGPRFLTLAWPAFMAACLLELVVFAFVDPMDVHWSGVPLGLSRQGVYTLSFFVFWVISYSACVFTTLLRMTPAEINECPFAPGDRPEGCPGR